MAKTNSSGLAQRMLEPLKQGVEFIQQVRSEVSKVTWPTRNETLVTTVMVFIMAILASIFFFAADQIIAFLIGQLLGR